MEFQPIFDYLKDKGYGMKGEHFYVEGFPVQFLPTGKDLLVEAVTEANEFQLAEEVIIRVMLSTDGSRIICESEFFSSTKLSTQTNCKPS